jgi:hypothetical protein
MDLHHLLLAGLPGALRFAPKAMPIILTKPEEREVWMRAP